MENSRAGRHLASLRQTREKVCPVCGTTFQAFAKQTYDTRQCSRKADYQRHAEERRAKKRVAYERRAAGSVPREGES